MAAMKKVLWSEDSSAPVKFQRHKRTGPSKLKASNSAQMRPSMKLRIRRYFTCKKVFHVYSAFKERSASYRFLPNVLAD